MNKKMICHLLDKVFKIPSHLIFQIFYFMRVVKILLVESILDPPYKRQIALFVSFKKERSKIAGYVLEKLDSKGFEKRAALFLDIRSLNTMLDLLSIIEK